MENLSEAKSTLRLYSQCFICREWGWDVSKVREVRLCLPCYVDVLEVRQHRQGGQKAGGVMGAETRSTSSAPGDGAFTPESDELPGNSPPPFRQLEMFE